jgi:DNA modification methylase
MRCRPGLAFPAWSPVPATVLDPFGGSGTTALVANQLGRDAILIELNPDYARMAERRIGKELRPGTYRDETREEEAPLFCS